MSEQLAELKTQRASTKGCITRIKNLVEQKADTLTATELECRLGILESYFKQVLTYQSSIEQLSPDDNNEIKVRSELEELYCAAKSKLLSLMNGSRKASMPLTDFGDRIIVGNSLHNNLPKIRLPQFSGKYTDFPNFTGCFTKLVHADDTLSNLEKFNHLLSCLNGAALRTIKSFEVTEENYSKALAQLKARYDNKYLIFQEHIVELFNMPQVSKNNAIQLRTLIDNANAHLSALLSIGSAEDIANAFLIHIVNSKLDSDTQQSWEANMDFSRLPSWQQCYDILSKRSQYLESRGVKVSLSEKENSRRQASKTQLKHSRNLSNNAISLTTVQPNCAFCEETGHVIYKCKRFLEIPISERFAAVKQKSLCVNCLFKGHTVKSCKVKKCRICASPHHTLLHRYIAPPDNVERADGRNNTALQTLRLETEREHVFLATAIIKVKDKFGRDHQARALLDSASQLNFVTERFAQFLQLPRRKVETSISGIGDTNSQIRYSAAVSIGSKVTNYRTNLQVFILPKITGPQPERKIAVNSWRFPKNIQLADPQFFEPQDVDLLIGTELFFQLLCVGQVRLDEGLPILQKTLLGWIVAGRYCDRTFSQTRHCNLVCTEELTQSEKPSLETLVEKFWQEESLSPASPWNEEQIQCETIFQNSYKRVTNGRFMVKLPFKADPSKCLGNSFEAAKRRFFCLEKKLNRNADLKCQYSQFLKDYLVADQMELISRNEIPHVHYFLPHQCVIRPESTSTKLRVVFDASCRTSLHNSLNDLLMVGPVIQNDLFSILLRFRSYKFALTADIEAMYRQILVYPEDRNFQLILWRESPSEEFQIYRLKTVTYGTAAAPFLATRCLMQLAEDFSQTMPMASNIIKRDFYMDDLIGGADTRQELESIKNDIDFILSTAQFKLRKWYSNNATFLQQIPEDTREKLLKVNNYEIVEALGIIWDPVNDKIRFQYKDSFSNVSRITKRIVLSKIACLFDPLGIINPIIVKGKVFLQELWILKLHWDESLPMELENRWNDFIKDLNNLNNLEIPRSVFATDPVAIAEIHGFADASVRAYGCCIYIRTIYQDGKITARLLTSKSKVAPIRATRSLPCLELCAALLLARLLSKVRGTFAKPFNNIYLWSDSKIVLDWLSRHPSTWKTFVANRVSEIQELTQDACWRHVGSKSNPADIISRGATVSDLLQSMWFFGPDFLYKSDEEWPPLSRSDPSLAPERRKVKTILVCAVSENLLNTIYSCTSFIKNCRRFAWVLRYLQNLKLKSHGSPINTTTLTAVEIDNAFLKIVSIIQRQEFAEDIHNLEKEEDIHSKSRLKALNPILDVSCGNQLLRVGGRLQNAKLPYDAKFPILLPRNNPFVKSYINHLHYKNFHAGPSALVSIVRQRFWIINGREYARKVVRSCIHCFKYRPRLIQQVMGNLPKGRVNISLPFTHCGVDFCGPFNTTYGVRGKHTYKSYVAIFICFATKAVHIEVVSNLTAEAFIAALKRFIGRRNLCRHIYCDNATNFVGAKRQLEEFRSAFFQQHSQDAIQQWCSNNDINFHHIPPRAPHFGGIWEAAVKSAKAHLYRTFQGSLLTFEELTTVMTQIEGVLNSRPITPLSSDPNDEQALTPAHFLTQAPMDCFVEPDLSSQKINYLHRWQRISALLQHFWRRWTKEYVSGLQQRFRWQSAKPDVSIGTLVLIHQEDLPPYKWKLGRVVSTTTGSDGHVRVADIKTSGGILQRAVHKLAPLPIDEEH